MVLRLLMHSENWLHNEAEVAQYSQQFAVAECLASGCEACPPGRLLEQRVGGKRLKEAGLLIVAVAVDHAMHTTERAGAVNRIQRSIDARVLPWWHLVLHAGGDRKSTRLNSSHR